MIEHFTQADEDYGRRVKEEIEKRTKELEAMSNEDNVPGRESGKSKYGHGGQGSLSANEAAKEAVQKSHESNPY